MALMTLMVVNVIGTPLVTTNTTNAIDVDTWTNTIIINETVNASYYVATDSGFTAIIDLQNSTSHLLTHSFTVNNNLIEANTLYYWRINGTNNASGLSYTLEEGVTTTQNTISGSARAVMRLFVLLALGTVMVGVVVSMNNFSNLNPKKLLITLASATLGALILFGFVTAVLNI